MGAELAWKDGERNREIYVGRPDVSPMGVVELTDNNPLVCADAFSVPSPASTLAVLAMGPLAEAGLIAERPVMLVNVDSDEDELAAFLATYGWRDGALTSYEPMDLSGVVAASVICSVPTPERLEDLDDLFEERYGRSFFVRRSDEEAWDTKMVAGKPHAAYRLRVSPDEPNSLLTIQIMADCNGKCGAGQIVHAMNVMCGFEESLGIA